MKKLLLGLLFFASSVFGQTFPVNNLTVGGTALFSGQATFSVAPFGVTPTTGDSSLKLATTAFVANGFAGLNSPAFTGIPTAPTAAVGTNSIQIATTAFVAAHDPCPSILDYGGNNTGASSNNTAFASAVAASPTGQVCVNFPAGTYAFSSSVSYTFPNNTSSLTLQGAGAENSKFLWAAGGGLVVNYLGPLNSVHIRDVAILTGTTATGTGILLNQTAGSIPNPANSALSDITSVVVRGSDTYAGINYWGVGIQSSGVSNVNFIGDMITGNNATVPQGIGIVVAGTASLPPVVFNLTASTLNNLSVGFQYGNYVQGVTVSQSNFTYVTNSIYVPAGETNLDQLTVVGNQFGMPPNASSGVNLSSWVPFTMISNNLFFINGTDAGVIGISGLMTVTGNTFHGDGAGSSNGFVVTSTNSFNPSVVTGNVFNSLASGIFLQTNAKNVNVQSNNYFGNVANVSNSGGVTCPASGTGNCIGGGSQ